MRTRPLLLVILTAAVRTAGAQTDTPCSAPLIPVHQDTCTFQEFTTVGAAYQNDAANGGTPNCAFPASPDVWFSLVVPVSGSVAITTEEGSITDGGMAVYRGPCDALQFIECDDDAAAGMMPVIDRSDLIPGETLYVRLWRAANNGTGTFSICAVESHSDCSEAIPVCHSFHVDGSPYGPGSVVDELAAYCDISEFQSEWFRFYFITAGSFGFKIYPDAVNGMYPDYDWLLFQAADTAFCTAHTPDTPPIACNGSSSTGPEGETGLDASGVSNSVPAGPGNPFCPVLEVNAGDLYFLFINNFTTTSTGFQMDLSGSAILDCGLPLGDLGPMASTRDAMVFPSPAAEEAWFQSARGDITRVDLVDALGRIVRSIPQTGPMPVRIPLYGIAPGTYWVSGSARNSIATDVVRLVVE